MKTASISVIGALVFVILSSTSGAFASDKFHETFLPKNKLHLMDLLDAPSNLDEPTFNRIADQTIEYFKPFAALHKGTLSVNKHWQDSTVNASADQDETGTLWTLEMYGGLARRPEITPDGFALVVCHELGHHFGGFAFYSDTLWAATEGQADYFAAHACARTIWASDYEENAKHRATAPAAAKVRCDGVWKTAKEQDLCYRVADASTSVATLLALLNDSNAAAPSFSTPDTSTVSETFEAHPAAQCRLDTYFSGGLCALNFDLRVIPGHDTADGEQSIAAEKESSIYTCMKSSGYSEGLRPACWFKARL